MLGAWLRGKVRRILANSQRRRRRAISLEEPVRSACSAQTIFGKMQAMSRFAIGCWLIASVLTSCTFGSFKEKVIAPAPMGERSRHPLMKIERDDRMSIINRSINLNDARACMLRSYVLAPDRRFIQAIVEIKEFCGDPVTAPIMVRLHGRKWDLSINGAAIGSLNEYAGFEEQMSLLQNYASSQLDLHQIHFPPHDAHDKEAQQIAKFGLNQPLAGLNSLNRTWSAGDHCQVLLKLAAHAWVKLLAQSNDPLEIADSARAKALALEAIALAANIDSSKDDLFALKVGMGYMMRGSAANPTQLPEPYTAWNTRNATNSGSSYKQSQRELQQLIGLIATVHSVPFDEWKKNAAAFAGADTEKQFAILEALARSRYMNLCDTVFPKIMSDCVRSLNNEPALSYSINDLNASSASYCELEELLPRHLIDDFEKSAGRIHADAGPFLNADIAREVYRGHFYRGFDGLVEYYCRFPDNYRYLLQLADYPFATSGELKDFLKAKEALHMVPDAKTLFQSFARCAELGRGVELSLMREFDNNADVPLNPEYCIPVARKICQTMDARPVTRGMLLDTQSQLLMFPEWQKTVESSFHQAFTKNVQERHEPRDEFAGYPVKPADISTHSRADAYSADYLVRHHYNPVRAPFAAWKLLSKDQLSALETYARAALKTPREPVQKITVTCTLVTCLAFQGRLKEAEKLLKSIGNCDQSEYLATESILSELEGDVQASNQWAAEICRIYTQIGPMFAAGMYWRHGEYARAAKALRQAAPNMTPLLWNQEVAISFLENLPTLDKQEKAAKSLVAEKLNTGKNLGQIADRTYFLGMPESAFMLHNNLQDGDVFLHLTSCYLDLYQWKGDKAAREWLTKQPDKAQLDRYAPNLLSRGCPEVLWTDEEAPIDRNVFLYRAAAAPFVVMDETEKKTLLKHFTDTQDTNALIGRVLLKQEVPDVLTTKQLRISDAVAAAFFLGWRKYESGCDYTSGSTWMRLAAELHADDPVSSDWARDWVHQICWQVDHYDFNPNHLTLVLKQRAWYFVDDAELARLRAPRKS